MHMCDTSLVAPVSTDHIVWEDESDYVVNCGPTFLSHVFSRFSSCGVVNGIESAVDLAKRGLEPFSPKPSFNLVDNAGTWVEQPYN